MARDDDPADAGVLATKRTVEPTQTLLVDTFVGGRGD